MLKDILKHILKPGPTLFWKGLLGLRFRSEGFASFAPACVSVLGVRAGLLMALKVEILEELSSLCHILRQAFLADVE